MERVADRAPGWEQMDDGRRAPLTARGADRDARRVDRVLGRDGQGRLDLRVGRGASVGEGHRHVVRTAPDHQVGMGRRSRSAAASTTGTRRTRRGCPGSSPGHSRTRRLPRPGCRRTGPASSRAPAVGHAVDRGVAPVLTDEVPADPRPVKATFALRYSRRRRPAARRPGPSTGPWLPRSRPRRGSGRRRRSSSCRFAGAARRRRHGLPLTHAGARSSSPATRAGRTAGPRRVPSSG